VQELLSKTISFVEIATAAIEAEEIFVKI